MSPKEALEFLKRLPHYDLSRETVNKKDVALEILEARLQRVEEENRLMKGVLHDVRSLCNLLVKRQDLVEMDRIVEIARNRRQDVKHIFAELESTDEEQ